jgi:hypothetical protein
VHSINDTLQCDGEVRSDLELENIPNVRSRVTAEGFGERCSDKDGREPEADTLAVAVTGF